MKISHISALVIKEYHQIVRDPSSFLIAFVLPIILIVFFAYAISLDVNSIKIGLVIEDDSHYARTLAGSFIRNKYFDVKTARNRHAFDDAINAGDVRGIIIIPRNFGLAIESNEIQPIELITDGSEPNTANFIQNYVTALWGNWNTQESALASNLYPSNITIENRVWYNPELESKRFLLPGALALIMTIVGSLLTGLVVSREWERGTMEAILSSTVTRGELVLSKLIPYFLLGILSVIVSTVIIIGIFQVPFRGTILAFGICSSIFLMSALSIGLYISTISKNQFLACQITSITTFMPSFLLSGFIFEINSMPFLLRLITYVIPARYLIACLQSIFMVGNVLTILIPNLIYLGAVAAVFLALTLAKTQTRLE